MGKRWIALLVLLLVCRPMPTEAVGTSASAAVLMEADSGRVLYAQNEHEPRLIASTTKLLTALTALESGHPLDEVVTIQPEWTGVEGTSLYLRPGEQLTLETLLYGLLLASGNDGAVAIAGHCGGTVQDFVQSMNQKARELGMRDSFFENPSGLDGEGHRASAYDMALLARACLRNDTLKEIAATRSITREGRTFTNHNKLLWRYEGCVGLKTGFTKKAGRTLVSAAERDGMTLICVTLHDPNDWADHTALLDWGFANYRVKTPVEGGEVLCRLPTGGSLLPFCPLTAGEGLPLCLMEGEKVRRELRLDRTLLEGPLNRGTTVGEAVYWINEVEAARVPLVTGAAVTCDIAPKRGIIARLLGEREPVWKNVCKN